MKRTRDPIYPEHPKSEHKWRIERARKLMEEANIDALMLARNVNVFYATGTRFVFVLHPYPPLPPRPQSVAIITPNEVTYSGRFSPFDSDAVGLETSWADIFEYVNDNLELQDVLKKCGVKRGDRIGTEWGEGGPASGINPIKFESLKKRVSDELGAEFVDATTLIWKMRSIKSNFEIERMRKAATAAAKAMDRILDFVEIGMNELEVARKVSIFMLEEGADAISHNQVISPAEPEPLISCAALDRNIQKGYVNLDIGAFYKLYRSDINRGAMLGRQPTEDEKKLYECRVGINEIMERTIRPRVSMDEVLKEVDDYVRGCGCEMQKHYGGLFGGHGIGMESHESPNIAMSANQPAFQNEEGRVEFETGMTFTFEAPVRRAGCNEIFVVEDDVAVTDTGCEVLDSMLSRELRIKP